MKMITLELNKKNFQKWMKALRSGDYEQAQGALIVEADGKVGYCCMGVGCVVADLPLRQDLPKWEHKDKAAPSLGLPKKEFWEWLGFKFEDDDSNYYDLAAREGNKLSLQTCAGANDDDEWTFEEIADWLENNQDSLELS